MNNQLAEQFPQEDSAKIDVSEFLENS